MDHRITFRKATLQDSNLLFSWRNDEATRKNSITQDTVRLEGHEAWVRDKISDPGVMLLIAQEAGAPVGTVRADFRGAEAELSWTVAPEARGRGIGRSIVAAAVDLLDCSAVTAKIKPDNTASVKIAESAGFILEKVSDGLGFWRLLKSDNGSRKDREKVMDLLELNCEKLKNIRIGIAEKLLLPETPAIELEQLTGGEYTFKYGGRYFHSRYNPWKEAKVQADELLSKQSDWIILFGLGCGYLLRTLIKEGKEKIIVYDPAADILKGVLKKIDLSEALSKEDVYLCNDVNDMISIMRSVTEGMDNILSYQTTPYKLTFPEEVKDSSNKVMNAHVMSAVGIKTEVVSRLDWVNNYFSNLDSFIKYPPVDILKGFKDIPMVVVGAGPSLKKNAHLLKELQGRAVIIAAVTAYKPLLSYGIIPDFVVAAEKVDLPEYFTYDERDREMRLILADVAHPNMYERDVKNKLVFYNSYSSLGPTFARFFGNDYYPTCGGSVTTVALDIGVMFGFDPVILIGQDLSFGEGRTHVSGGVYISQDIRIDEEKGNLIIEEDYVTPEMTVKKIKNTHKLLWLKGLNGQRIPSKFDWVSFHQWFENYMVRLKAFKFPTKVINATEGGAYIEGMEHITLREAIDRYIAPKNLTRPVQDVIREAEENRKPVDFEGLYKVVKRMETSLEEIHKLANRIVKEAGSIKKMCKAGKDGWKDSGKKVKKMKKLENSLFAKASGASFIWDALTAYTYRLKEYLREEPEDNAEEQFRHDLNAIIVSYKNIAIAGRKFIPVMKKSLETIETNLKMSGLEVPQSLENGESASEPAVGSQA